jgi:hypothetical protein
MHTVIDGAEQARFAHSSTMVSRLFDNKNRSLQHLLAVVFRLLETTFLRTQIWAKSRCGFYVMADVLQPVKSIRGAMRQV